VIEWLSAEQGRGRAVELAVLNRRRHEYRVPAGIVLVRRDGESVEAFVSALGARWRSSDAPVSAHLVGDALLALLWTHGVRTVPVIHNTREGWRNDPSAWRPDHVPLAVACAEAGAHAGHRGGLRRPGRDAAPSARGRPVRDGSAPARADPGRARDRTGRVRHRRGRRDQAAEGLCARRRGARVLATRARGVPRDRRRCPRRGGPRGARRHRLGGGRPGRGRVASPSGLRGPRGPWYAAFERS